MKNHYFISLINIIFVLVCFEITFTYGQDSSIVKNKKNTIYFSTIHSYNGIFKKSKSNLNGEEIKQSYNTSFEFSYRRNLLNRFGLIFNSGIERREHSITNVLFTDYLPMGSHGSNWGYRDVRKNIVSKQFFFIVGVNPFFDVFKSKYFNVSSVFGLNYCSPIIQNFYYPAYSSESEKISFLSPTNNYKLNGEVRIEHFLKKSFTLGYSLYYNMFLNKTNSAVNFKDFNFIYSESKGGAKLQYWSCGLKLGIGYKW